MSDRRRNKNAVEDKNKTRESPEESDGNALQMK
jgi:hypothetical protein